MLRNISLISFILGGLITLLTLISYQSKLNGPDKSSCRVVWMYPSYIKLDKFDETHTKYASKYSIYLYREQGKDKIPKENDDMELDGVPVLFIPGNAGNYRQARSIAARTTELFQEMEENHDHFNFKKLDFFTADFNEDFTAFHGRTILDQSEFCNEAIKFIQSLYPKKQKVLIIGHSMGGIVSRIMLTLPNYIENSVETIITLSSPHSASPLTFDGELSSIYSAIDKFWYEGYNNQDSSLSLLAQQRLKNLILISITGGALDSTLPADYTSLGYLVPPSNGFTVFTTGIPLVWTPIDHLAIVWCQQLRTAIANSLLDVVNIIGLGFMNEETSVIARMKVFKNYYLTGFENTKPTLLLVKIGLPATQLQENYYNHIKTPYEKCVFDISNSSKNYQFSLISSVKDNEYYVEKENKMYELGNLLSTIPNPKAQDISDSSYDGDYKPYYSLELNSTFLRNYHKLYILNKGETQFQLSSQQTNYKFQGKHLATIGDSITIPENHPFVINLNIPQAYNSLYVYKLKFSEQPLLVRQWTQDPYESKWFSNLESTTYLTMHGIAPFVPHKKNKQNYSMNLQIWSKPQKDIKVFISIDYLQSLKLLVLRYRITIVGINIFIIYLIILLQFNAEKFPSFGQILIYLNSKYLIHICVGLILLNYLTTFKFLHYFDPVLLLDYNKFINDVTTNGDKFQVNLLFLGLVEKFSIIGILLYLVSSFIVGVMYIALISIGSILHFIINSIPSISFKSPPKFLQLVIIILVLSLIPYYIPYQIAYLLCCIVQAYNVAKNWTNMKIINYQISILILMLWILPINIPILIVFIHNLQLNWKTPFSSHHNLLSIIPIVLLVYKNKNLKSFSIQNIKFKWLNNVMLTYLGFYSLIYGSRNTFFIHHLFNLYSCLLLYIMKILNH